MFLAHLNDTEAPDIQFKDKKDQEKQEQLNRFLGFYYWLIS